MTDTDRDSMDLVFYRKNSLTYMRVSCYSRTCEVREVIERIVSTSKSIGKGEGGASRDRRNGDKGLLVYLVQ